MLEIACGTGLCTEALAGHAESLTAIDAAPETLAIARRRVPSAKVRFEVADVFAGSTTERFDVVFFAGWLSHAPTVMTRCWEPEQRIAEIEMYR